MEKINNTFGLLKRSWQLENDETSKETLERYSKLDQEALMIKEIKKDGKTKVLDLKMSYFYPTHLWPHPWWGNIENPEMIVLALNPSYDPLKDEEDEEVTGFQDAWKNGLSEPENKDKHINLFDFKETETAKWWAKVFKGKEKEIETIELLKQKEFSKKVGMFNLVGYHSLEYFNFPEKALRKEIEDGELKKIIDKFNEIKKKIKYDNKKEVEEYDYSFLPTQNAIRLHIQYLLTQKNEEGKNKVKYIIIIWGKNRWKKELKLELEKFGYKEGENIFVLNEHGSRNKNINVFLNNKKEKGKNKKFKEYLKEKIGLELMEDKNDEK